MCVLAETYSEAVKILKGDYVVRAIEKHNMDRALIFCRTKLDCDNLERYLNEVGKGTCESTCTCTCYLLVPHPPLSQPPRGAGWYKIVSGFVCYSQY